MSTGLYDYRTPPGFGDTFFQYVFDAQDAVGLTDGQDKMELGVEVVDGDFLYRYLSGVGTMANGIRVYDWMKRRTSSDWLKIGVDNWGRYAGQLVQLPEIQYPVRGNIRFDLQDIDRQVSEIDGALTIYSSQIVFSGARRRPGIVGDPVPSNYRYYEKPYIIPYTLELGAASSGGQFLPPQRVQIPVNDYDFELRRMEIGVEEDYSDLSPFKVTLYNTDKQQMSNKPVLSNLLFHASPIIKAGVTDEAADFLNFWPCPPMLYRVNSQIQMDVYSLVTDPMTIQLAFVGVRRIPCN